MIVTYEGNEVPLPEGYSWGHQPAYHGALAEDRMAPAGPCW